MHKRIKSLPAALAIAVLLLGPAAPAFAQEEPKSSTERAEELAREGAQRLMSALETLLQVIPQYGMPRIEENGDIVIPRLDKPEAEDEPERDQEDPESTPESGDEDEVVIEETST